jgi:hypothetical protein
MCYEYNRGVFVAMFADFTYLHIYDNESDDEEVNEDHDEKPWVVDMCKLMTSDDASPTGNKKRSQPTFKFIHTHKENTCSNG